MLRDVIFKSKFRQLDSESIMQYNIYPLTKLTRLNMFTDYESLLSAYHSYLSICLVLSFRGDCAQDGCWGLLETRPRDKLEARNVEQIGVMDPEPRSAVGSR